MTRIAAIGHAFPENYYDQDMLIEALKRHWGTRHHNLQRLDALHRNVLVGGRHLALPLEAYEDIDSFEDSNNAFIECGVDIGARAITDALTRAGLEAAQVDHIFFVSTTGIATPSLDARLVNALGFSPNIKRTPIFGLGCAAGAVGITRCNDFLKAYPESVALLLSVEFCSLTLQRKDLSIPNIIATGLFGDGAAAVVMTGDSFDGGASNLGDEGHEHGPSVVATRSVFYPETERVMGWDISGEGFQVVLSAEIPDLVRKRVRIDVDAFLDAQALNREDLSVFVCHPGGPRILQALQESLEIPDSELEITWDALARYGNLSSASVLMVLERTLEVRQIEPGSYGLLMAMGPGFCSELVLLRW